jgi:GT2 family glycosyltransferase
MTNPVRRSEQWPRVSLLMPNRDNAAVLDLVLDRLARNTDYDNFELIVLDDGSTDGSREILRRWRDSGRFREFRLIERDHTEGGVVDALNQGLQAATGEFVVQLDADASVETPGWLEQMVTFLMTDARIGVVTAKVILDSGELQAAGWNYVCLEPVGDETAEVDGGMGACMMYRREAAMAVGGYDRGFAPVWLDDLDLTFALRREGFKVFCLPRVLVIHHLGKRDRASERPQPAGTVRRATAGIRRGVGRMLPNGVRARLVRRLGWDRGPREDRRRRAQHLEYWRRKWGWDLHSPDAPAIRARWGETEICWSMNPEMRRAGERIIATFEAADRDNRRPGERFDQ